LSLLGGFLPGKKMQALPTAINATRSSERISPPGSRDH
jgi:hypothetical protein